MSRNQLKNFIENKNCTLLSVGPMSVNCVDAVCEIVNKHSIPIMLIASRRQVDSKSMGGGYVNNSNTEEFSKYVTSKDKKNITLKKKK